MDETCSSVTTAAHGLIASVCNQVPLWQKKALTYDVLVRHCTRRRVCERNNRDDMCFLVPFPARPDETCSCARGTLSGLNISLFPNDDQLTWTHLLVFWHIALPCQVLAQVESDLVFDC